MANSILAIGFPGLPEMIILGLIVLVLFGTRLPSVMRSLGVGITEFRKGIKGEIDEEGQPAIDQQDEQASKSAEPASHSTSSTTA